MTLLHRFGQQPIQHRDHHVDGHLDHQPDSDADHLRGRLHRDGSGYDSGWLAYRAGSDGPVSWRSRSPPGFPVGYQTDPLIERPRADRLPVTVPGSWRGVNETLAARSQL